MENQYQRRARLIAEADRLVADSAKLFAESGLAKEEHRRFNKAKKAIRLLVKSAPLYADAGLTLAAAYSYGSAAEVAEKAIGDFDLARELTEKCDAIDAIWEGEEAL